MMRYTFILFVFFLCVLQGCSQKPEPLKKVSEARPLMGTVIRLDMCVDSSKVKAARKAYDEAWLRLEDISWRMNVYDKRSDLSKIHQAKSMMVTTSADTYDIIRRSINYSKMTRGAFDITIWPLLKLWRDYQDRNTEPSILEIREVKKNIGSDMIELWGNNQLKLKSPETQLDLGGIAKGYSIDEVAKIFRDAGFEHFHIDAGGDIYVGGFNCAGQPWRIGIRHPKELGKIIGVVELSNQALTTSGNYEQYIEINDKKFSHIINPQTGYPQERVVSASVIAPSAEEADVFSTALTVLSTEEGEAFINGLNPRYASLVFVENALNQLEEYPSKHFKKYQIKH